MKINVYIKLSQLMGLTMLVTGCLYGQCITGPCPLEHSRILNSIKPYGAHWIKYGMTKESRRKDMSDCGSVGKEAAEFSDDQIRAEMNHDYPDKYGASEYKNAEKKLSKKWVVCMKEKGYVYLEDCDSRCLCEKSKCDLEDN